MEGGPQREHNWLQQLVGEWTVGSGGEETDPTCGTERVRSLGGYFVVCEMEGEMPCGGGAASTVMTLGFDPRKNKFVGTWVGSMMSHLWVYEGTLDESETVLTLETEGPSMSGDGGTARLRDIIELDGPDQRRLRSTALGDDGQWTEFMRTEYQRIK